MSIYPTTSIIPRNTQKQETATFKLALTDFKGFEQVILARAESRQECYDAYRAWFTEYRADPSVRDYPSDTWAVCTSNGEIVWKTYPFIAKKKA